MSTMLPPGRARRDQAAWMRTPTLKTEDGQVLEWVRTNYRPESPRRRWQTQRAALNLWMYLGRHWIEPLATLSPAGGGYSFREIYRTSNASFPNPVTNYIAAAVDNEVARLCRKQYSPDPTAGKNKPAHMAAARLARDILRDRMERSGWEDVKEQLVFNSVIEGIAIARTWWDESESEVTLVQSPAATRCPRCSRLFADAKMPSYFLTTGMPDGSGGFREPFHLDSAKGGAEDLELQHCPFCEKPSALQRAELNEGEAATQDPWGRDLGLLVPRGSAEIEVLNVHTFYPENAGIGVEPHEQMVSGQIVVRSLEWICQRYPMFESTVQREDPATLLRYNPLFADTIFQGAGSGFGYGGGYGSGYDAYGNHARVIEVVCQPQPVDGLELGAHFVVVNDRVARQPLCVEVQDEDGKSHPISKIRYHFARSKRIPKNFYGRSFVDDMVPLNKRLNEVDAQGVDLRERGKPNMWVPQGTDLLVNDEVQGNLTVIEYDSADGVWTPKEGLFPGFPMSGSSYSEERNAIIRDLQALGAPQEIERGQAPGSVKTTSGLMLLSEEASRQRDFRERGLVRLYESIFEHDLEMQWAFRKEEAAYEVRSESGVWEQESYTGADLLGGMRVKMEARLGYDQTLYNKEASAEALEQGLYRLDSPDAVDRILDLQKLPKDVNEKATLQIERAEQAWHHFLRKREIPIIDQTIHDPIAWYAVLGKRWIDDEAYLLQRECGWANLLPRLTLWEQKLAQTEAAEAPAKAIYQNFPESEWPKIQADGEEMTKQAQAAYDQAMQSYNAATASAAELGQPAPAPPPLQPPPPFPVPPPQGFLPDAIELKIYTIWRRMLPELDQALVAAQAADELADVLPPAAEVQKVKELDALLKIRAVIEGYRKLASGQVGPAALPPPAPGSAPGPPPPGGPGPAAAPPPQPGA